MRTTMSARHIWGFERGDTEMRLAREAGWRRSELVWERAMEAGNRAWEAGRVGRARWLFVLADRIAVMGFGKGDPRRATAPAALARLFARQGRSRKAQAQARRALAEWAGVGAFIDAVEIRPRARSSLFHLRMEVRHRDTFHDNLRTRYRNFAEETRETMAGLAGDGPLPAHRHFGRWRGERPSIFDDTRRVLSACLLIPDPPRG
ncbi:tetratricopeptide repeat-containing protein [Roseovarius sp.]|uniref:tetratricopeptide repeat-containing protein n=1 Tax=Roseovarius sp. TaxID=1486281 RepID=UPI0026354EA0|nr:tetratricopeptide repeat-containing protein [Roseovarius sp.]